jgi:hypothetical protein
VRSPPSAEKLFEAIQYNAVVSGVSSVGSGEALSPLYSLRSGRQSGSGRPSGEGSDSDGSTKEGVKTYEEPVCTPDVKAASGAKRAIEMAADDQLKKNPFTPNTYYGKAKPGPKQLPRGR